MVVKMGAENLEKQNILSTDFAKSWEKISRELNEVRDSVGGKEKMEGLSELLTKNLEQELTKPENKKFFESLIERTETINNNPELRRKAGEGFQQWYRFAEGMKKGKGAEMKADYDKKSFRDYKEFMDKLKDPETLKTLSGMTREEVDRVKVFLKSHTSEAYDMYNTMKKFRSVELKRQDKEFFDGVWETIKTNYNKDDNFFSKIYGKPEATIDFLRKFVLSDWQGEEIKSDSRAFRNSDIFDKDYLMEKFNKMNQERIENNYNKVKDTIRLKNLTEQARTDILNKFKIEGNTLKFNDGSDFNLLDFEAHYKNDIILKIRKMYSDEKVVFAHESETNKVYENCKKEIYENMVFDIKNQLKQKEKNDLLGGELNLDAIKQLARENMFIEKAENGEVIYRPEKARNYLKENFKLEGNGEDTSRQNLKKLNGTQKQAWIAALQVLLNSNMPNEKPIKVNGVYEDKEGNETRDRVWKFQQSLGFGDSNGAGKLDGRPGPITMKALAGVQEKREIEHSKLSGDMAGIGKFDNGEFKFNDGIFNDGIANIKGKEYRQYEDNMNGLGYSSGKDNGEFGWKGLDCPYLYMGNFENGKRSGEGTMYFANGDVFQGNFKEGKLDGTGHYFYKNGDIFYGTYENGEMNGLGNLTLKEGKGNYIGKFDFGSSKFTGTFTGDGVIKTGEFSIDNNDYYFKGGGVIVKGNTYDVLRDDRGLRIIGGDDNGKYLNDNNWTIVSGEELDKRNDNEGNNDIVNNTVVNNAINGGKNDKPRPGEPVESPKSKQKPVENSDPDGIAVFGYKRLKNEPRGLRQNYGIPKSAKCVYDSAPGHAKNKFYFYVDGGRIYRINRDDPYQKYEMEKNAYGTSKGRSINVCNSGLESLNRKLNDFPEVKVIIKGNDYYMKCGSMEAHLTKNLLDYYNMNRMALIYRCLKLRKENSGALIYYDWSGLKLGYSYQSKDIEDKGWCDMIIRNGETMSKFCAIVNKYTKFQLENMNFG